MKYLFPTISLLIGFAVGAMAAVVPGNLPITAGNPAGKGQAAIQNLSAIAAGKGKSRCDTVASDTAVLKNYSASGYIGIKANATNPHTGAPVAVKWLEDGKQVWVGSEYEGVNNQGATFTTLRANGFNNATTAFCVRRQ